MATPSGLVTGMLLDHGSFQHHLTNIQALGKSKEPGTAAGEKQQSPPQESVPAPSARAPSVSVKAEEKIVRLTVKEGREKIKNDWKSLGWKSTQIDSDIEEMTPPTLAKAPALEKKKKTIVSWGRSFVVSIGSEYSKRRLIIAGPRPWWYSQGTGAS